MNSITRRVLLILGAALILGVVIAGTAAAQSGGRSFRMLRPENAPQDCLEDAIGDVAIRSFGPVEIMTVGIQGMPPNKTFNLFVTQLPREPYGIAWYQGDIRTNEDGNGVGYFVGRFNAETFAVAPDRWFGAGNSQRRSLPGCLREPAVRPDTHLPPDVVVRLAQGGHSIGCPGDVTQFNGKHRAGIKALSTFNFPNDSGPLRSIEP